MLGITYHNPATISVFLDRMRFRDCFISTSAVRDGEWRRTLKQFIDLPGDGRDRVVFVESFAVLKSLVQEGAVLDAVKVAVYDDCDVLSKVPGARIVDAHINGSAMDTWQLYTVSFAEFNDALAEQPTGVPALLRGLEIRDDEDLPEPEQAAAEQPEPDDTGDDEPIVDASKPGSVLVMEQILDEIDEDEQDDTDEQEAEPVVPTPERAPKLAETLVPTLPKRPETMSVETDGTVGMTEQEPGDPLQVQPPAPKPLENSKKRKAKRTKKPKLESYELF
jgi:hypothetical protein